MNTVEQISAKFVEELTSAMETIIRDQVRERITAATSALGGTPAVSVPKKPRKAKAAKPAAVEAKPTVGTQAEPQDTKVSEPVTESSVKQELDDQDTEDYSKHA